MVSKSVIYYTECGVKIDVMITEWSVIYVGTFLSLLAASVLCFICYASFKRKKKSSVRGNKLKTNGSHRRSNGGQKYSRLEPQSGDQQSYEMRSRITIGCLLFFAYVMSIAFFFAVHSRLRTLYFAKHLHSVKL